MRIDGLRDDHILPREVRGGGQGGQERRRERERTEEERENTISYFIC